MLRAATFIEYSYYLTACSDLKNYIKIQVDPDVYFLSYGIIQHKYTDIKPMPTISAEIRQIKLSH
jgi:hypothetical protein